MDFKLYIQENFDELKRKIEEFSPKITINYPKINYDDKTKLINDITEDEEKDNELPQSYKDKLKEVEKDLDNYNYNTLYPLFRIPKGMTFNRFKELLKDNPVYKKFMRILPPDDEKY